MAGLTFWTRFSAGEARGPRMARVNPLLKFKNKPAMRVFFCLAERERTLEMGSIRLRPSATDYAGQVVHLSGIAFGDAGSIPLSLLIKSPLRGTNRAPR